jgi:phage host-nuclease inhibitor protein Gam
MSRIKPSIMKIENNDQADQALRRIVELKIKLEAVDGKYEKQIASLREKAAKEGEEARKEIESLGHSIGTFADYNKDELFAKVKTIDLNWGKFGFRLSTKLKIPRNKVQKIIDGLKLHFNGKGLRVKEEIDKEELKTWPTEDLVKIGASVTTEDEFWYEVSKDRVNEELLKKQTA